LEKLGHGLGGEIICSSASELEEYKKIGIEGSYINNGIQQSQRQPVVKKAGSKFRVVTSGRIVAQKNPALFNRIASYFEPLEQFEFVWVGDGESKAALHSANIRTTGWLNTEEVKKEIDNADLYISTSNYEGLSFALLEALSMHKPVLLSDCVGNKNVIKTGLNGGYFKNASEAIIKIMHYGNNQDMLPIMGRFSKQICASEFDSSHNFAVYRQRYQQNLQPPLGNIQ
jgi:glycosyltransferase involved in cell wall biosynthesis